jgi:hypothetical protein
MTRRCVYAVTVAALVVTVLVARAAAADESCVSGAFVGGGSRSVAVPAGELDVAVQTTDTYEGRRWTVVDQWSESITVAGRTTPDLADGVDSAAWSSGWRWTSAGTLTVTHAWPGTGPHSVSYRVCWVAVTPETTVPSTPPTVVSVAPEVTTTTGAVVTSVPMELAPATVATAELEQPSFTG